MASDQALTPLKRAVRLHAIRDSVRLARLTDLAIRDSFSYLRFVFTTIDSVRHCGHTPLS